MPWKHTSWTPLGTGEGCSSWPCAEEVYTASPPPVYRRPMCPPARRSCCASCCPCPGNGVSTVHRLASSALAHHSGAQIRPLTAPPGTATCTAIAGTGTRKEPAEQVPAWPAMSRLAPHDNPLECPPLSTLLHRCLSCSALFAQGGMRGPNAMAQPSGAAGTEEKGKGRRPKEVFDVRTGGHAPG